MIHSLPAQFTHLHTKKQRTSDHSPMSFQFCMVCTKSSSLTQGKKGEKRGMMKRNLANIEFLPCMFINPFLSYSYVIGVGDLTLWEMRNLVGGHLPFQIYLWELNTPGVKLFHTYAMRIRFPNKHLDSVELFLQCLWLWDLYSAWHIAGP